MKNKRLIILLSIFAFLTLVVILCSTLFTLRSVSFSWKSAKVYLQKYSDATIAESVDLGDSIFLLNKSKMTAKLESKYPYLRVIKIETKFPNKVVVHVVERDSVYAVKLTDKYALIDEDNKVLQYVTAEGLASWDDKTMGVKPIVATVYNNGAEYNLKESDFALGQIASVKRVTPLLKNMADTLKKYGYPSNSLLKGFADTINVNIAYQSDATIHTKYGLNIVIKDCYTNLTNKIALAYSVFEAQRELNNPEGTIVVEGNRAYIEA